MSNASEDWIDDDDDQISEMPSSGSSNMHGESLLFDIPDSLKGQRLDKALAILASDFSRSRLKALIEDGHVTIGKSAVTDAKKKVQPGQKISVQVPPPAPAIPQAEHIPLDVLYEDPDLIIINKPAGLVVHPAAGHDGGTLVNALLHHCQGSLSGVGGVARPGIVHRLDKDTSGIMVAAKHDAAHQGLAAQFADHSIDRAYIAITYGCPTKEANRIEGNIGRDPHNRKKMAIVENRGKWAATNYQVLQRYGDRYAKIRCILETGRTHQIRVHMASIGHALFGDPVYARPRKDPKLERLGHNSALFQRQALHAERLGFIHPISGAELLFQSDIPTDMKRLAGILELI